MGRRRTPWSMRVPSWLVGSGEQVAALGGRAACTGCDSCRADPRNRPGSRLTIAGLHATSGGKLAAEAQRCSRADQLAGCRAQGGRHGERRTNSHAGLVVVGWPVPEDSCRISTGPGRQHGLGPPGAGTWLMSLLDPAEDVLEGGIAV